MPPRVVGKNEDTAAEMLVDSSLREEFALRMDRSAHAEFHCGSSMHKPHAQKDGEKRAQLHPRC